jgi:ribosomal protein L3 glutamine methyltransferase
MPIDKTAIDDLATVRDWLRFATSRFTAENLAFGHGTSRAVDEAAYLILHTLHLPIDELDPWLDCRLTRAEREQVAAIIDKRIATRKPAPYLTNEAWIRGHSFYCDERVLVPRTYFGELLEDRLSTIVADPDAVGSVLDLCTGSGCIAILAAMTFPNASVDAVDISPDALAVAERNVAEYGLEDRVHLVRSDLFAGLAGKRYDLILSNPPYVAAEAMAAFSAEYRAEPAIAHAGGGDGMDLVRRILESAGRHLTPEGALVVEVGTGAPLLERDFPHLPFLWLATEESEGEVFALPASALR